MEKLIVVSYFIYDRDEFIEDEYDVENYEHAKDLVNLLFKSHKLGNKFVSHEYYFEDNSGNRSKFNVIGNNDTVWLEIDTK